MMRVLVLGADGFVGRRVMARLSQAAGIEPIAGTRRSIAAGDTGRVAVDATDRASLDAALRGVDAIVNAVAGDADTIRRNGTAVFAAAAGRRVVHLSSMAVYGAATGTIDETAPLAQAAGAYGDAKIAAERAADGDTVILRPGCIYGAGSPQWTRRIATLLRQRRIGDLGAAGDGCSNIVHVDDVARAVEAGLRGGSGAYNLAMPGAPDWNGYFLAFAKALGAVPVRRIPRWQMTLDSKLAAIPLKLAERLPGQAPPAIPPSLARLWAQDMRLDATRATREWALDWTPLESGVAEAASSL